jgi:transposase
MSEKLRFLGLDVHAETIAAAMAEPDGEVRSLGTIPNRMESVRKLLKKLGRVEKLRACYEAGLTGYVLYWQLAELGVQCEVIAPSLVPVKAGDRVKTDRRDAETTLPQRVQPGKQYTRTDRALTLSITDLGGCRAAVRSLSQSDPHMDDNRSSPDG